MKNNCELIKFSIEKYYNNKCSSKTNKIIEQHILKCNSCKQKLLEQPNGNTIFNNLIEKNKEKKLKFFLSLIIIFIFIFLSLTLLFNNFVQHISSDFNQDNPLYNFYLWITGNYKIQDYNYTNILEITNNEDNSITYTIYTFDTHNYLIEQKVVKYNNSKDKLQDEYNKYLNIEDNSKILSNIKLEDNILSYDINSVKNRSISDLFPSNSNISDNTTIIVLE